MKRLNIQRLALFGLISLTISGCDSIPFLSDAMNKTPDYKGAGRSRPLEVPPDLTSISSNDTFSVPGGSTTYSSYSQGQAEEPVEKEKLLPNPDSVRLERAGAQRWLVVKADPEKVWPVIRDFWAELGFAVRVENAQTGVMETEWVDPGDLAKDQNGSYLDKFQGWLDRLNTLNSRQKFRTRIDRGTDTGTTEIYMSHRSISETPDDGKVTVRTIYGPVDNGYAPKNKNNRTQEETARADAEDLDAELLRRLMVRLGVEEQKSRSILAANSNELHANLAQNKDGTVKLTVNDEFDRAWRRVGLALDRVGFVVEDKNRSQGLYYVKYTDVDIDDSPKKKKGLMDKLKFWGDDEDTSKNQQADKPADKVLPAQKNDAPVDDAVISSKKEDSGVIDKLKFWKADEKVKTDPSKQYRVKVESNDDGSEISVVNTDGSRNTSGTANRITKLLYEQLK